MNDAFMEVGAGVRTGNFQGYNAAMATENFAPSGSGQFLTGVTYLDSNGDRFYTPGEGKGGLSVAARLIGATTGPNAVSQAAGDYAMKVANGDYAVTFSGAGLVGPLTAFVTVTLRNVELDVVKADAIASSTNTRLGANVRELNLLGSADLTGTGNTLANLIIGNKGANLLDGAGGADSLVGGAGFDTFKLKAGEANGDVIVDFAGNGTAAGDRLLFEGYGAAAQLVALGNNQYRVSGNGFNDVIEVNGALAAGDYSFAGGVTPPPPPPRPPPPPPPPPPPDGTTITGTSNADNLTGTAANDVIKGLAGNDRLSGGDGHDTLYGGTGTDTLIDGNGNDLLIGEAGTDYLTGGLGRDRFVRVSAGDGLDVIDDFTRGPGGDVLDISDALIGFDPGDNVAEFVRLSNFGSATLVSVDSNGSAGGVAFSAEAYLVGVGTSDLSRLIADGNIAVT
ncbi:MAG: calcium-binding protein [Alphaproteobacteria bacterium]|nr:calcium-binding protein [Alphaproteobacteria bacterium]